MKKILSLTVLSAMLALVMGCETSNQSYSHSGRVVDVNAQSKKVAQKDYGIAGRAIEVEHNQNNEAITYAHQEKARAQQEQAVESYSVGSNNANYQYQQEQAVDSYTVDSNNANYQYQQELNQYNEVEAPQTRTKSSPPPQSHSALYDYERELLSTPINSPASTSAPATQASPASPAAPAQEGDVLYAPEPRVAPAPTKDTYVSPAARLTEPLSNNYESRGSVSALVGDEIREFNSELLHPKGFYGIDNIATSGVAPGAVMSADIVSYAHTLSLDNSAPLYAANNANAGNWLDVDSIEAKSDEKNSAQTQKALRSSAQMVYQNKISTTAGPDKYAVVKGDTLYSIAFRYGLDYHNLAKINKIEPPYNLKVGQVLILNLKAAEAPVYVVQKGDTLYSIARKNGQSVSFLAGVNNLEPPYNLKLGQKILLSRNNSMVGNANTTAAKESTAVPVAGAQSANNKNSTTASSNATTNKPTASKPSTPTVANTPIIKSKTRTVSGVTWSWPTTGKVIEKFSTAEQGNKGIDIAGNRGQPVLSAADGQVVYAGNALRGFGNLIIINHTNEYLSAYAHNDVLLVKEGQKVKRGQHIARMGSTDARSTRLHFEIRYRGQSVNPVSYLPK